MSRFMRALMHYYGVELHNFNPNSIAQAAIFATVYEGFLGIEPHWDLWILLFRVELFSLSTNVRKVCHAVRASACTLLLHSDQAQLYILSSSPPQTKGGRAADSTSATTMGGSRCTRSASSLRWRNTSGGRSMRALGRGAVAVGRSTEASGSRTYCDWSCCRLPPEEGAASDQASAPLGRDDARGFPGELSDGLGGPLH
jgi:hypothetical protein